MENKSYPTMNCERCGKEVKKIGNRKYCTQCRIVVDKEINSATRRKLREKEKIAGNRS